MDTTAQETVLKKRLSNFLQELHQIGSLTGFKHFTCYVRGKEELLISVSNTLQDAGVTLFLIAGYARYSCPYVWVRSNHERLLKLSGDMDSDRDSPLRLKSTAKWKDTDAHIIDIIAEVVRLCTYPAPRNPFEVDLDYFHLLPQPNKFLSSAAMAAYLQKIVVASPSSRSYSGKVFEDLQHVAKLHFTCLKEIINTAGIRLLQQQLERQHQQPQQQRRHSGPRMAHYPKIPAASSASQGLLPVYSAVPNNHQSGLLYGPGPAGIYPGSIAKVPAPSLF